MDCLRTKSTKLSFSLVLQFVQAFRHGQEAYDILATTTAPVVGRA